MTGITNPLVGSDTTQSSNGAVEKTAKDFETSLNGLTDDFNNFLSLLTIQLQNQDPTDPMDTDKMVQQLVDFTGVEQQIRSNKHLEEISSLTSANTVSQAISYIGLAVEYEGQHFSVIDGQTASTISYDLTEAVNHVEIRIYDESGSEVRYAESAADIGENSFNWDMQDNNDEFVQPGNYRAVVRATNRDGEAVELTQRVNSIVDGIDNTGGETVLTMGGQTLLPSQVTRVGL